MKRKAGVCLDKVKDLAAEAAKLGFDLPLLSKEGIAPRHWRCFEKM